MSDKWEGGGSKISFLDGPILCSTMNKTFKLIQIQPIVPIPCVLWGMNYICAKSYLSDFDVEVYHWILKWFYLRKSTGPQYIIEFRNRNIFAIYVTYVIHSSFIKGTVNCECESNQEMDFE